MSMACVWKFIFGEIVSSNTIKRLNSKFENILELHGEQFSVSKNDFITFLSLRLINQHALGQFLTRRYAVIFS